MKEDSKAQVTSVLPEVHPGVAIGDPGKHRAVQQGGRGPWRGKGRLPACTKLMGNSFSMAALIPGAGRRGVGGAG